MLDSEPVEDRAINLRQRLLNGVNLPRHLDKSFVEAALRGRSVDRIVVVEASSLTYQHMVDAVAYMNQAQSASRLHRVEKTLSDFGNTDLVMEMLKRGFAVMKLPEDGAPPTVLRPE